MSVQHSQRQREAVVCTVADSQEGIIYALQQSKKVPVVCVCSRGCVPEFNLRCLILSLQLLSYLLTQHGYLHLHRAFSVAICFVWQTQGPSGASMLLSDHSKVEQESASPSNQDYHCRLNIFLCCDSELSDLSPFLVCFFFFLRDTNRIQSWQSMTQR